MNQHTRVAGETCAAKPKPDTATVEFIARSGLVPPGATARFERLPGGVSSDIWLVRASDAAFCVKRALPQLRVAAEWHAPIGRNAKEAAWIKAVAGFMPEAVPGLLAEDRAAGMFAMRYLPPETYPNWKAQLADSNHRSRRERNGHGRAPKSIPAISDLTLGGSTDRADVPIGNAQQSLLQQGTDGSNPVPSSGESVANLTSSPCRPR